MTRSEAPGSARILRAGLTRLRFSGTTGRAPQHGTLEACAPRLERRNLLGGSLRPEVLAVQSIVEPADHHLFPGLRPPAHQLRRIRIEFVLGRIIEVRH